MSHSDPQPFQLQCFSQAPPGVAVSGQLGRQGERLEVHYQVLDPQARLVIPAAPAGATPSPQRRDALWTTTCLELFVAEVGATPYRELNLSPNGDWNLYRLSGYRQNLTPEPAVGTLPFRVERRSDGLRLSLRLELGRLFPPGQPLELGICAVLEESAGALTYWALHHPGAEADFHRREGFRLRV